MFHFLTLLSLCSADEYVSPLCFNMTFSSRQFRRMREPVELDEIFALLLRIVRNEGKTVRIILMGSWKCLSKKKARARSTMRLHLP